MSSHRTANPDHIPCAFVRFCVKFGESSEADQIESRALKKKTQF